MLAARSTTLCAIAAALLLAGCGDEDDDGLFTGPDGRGPRGTAFDADCEEDAVAPTIRFVRVSPAVLWPPDHRMVPVTVDAEADDPCDPLDVAIVSVRSDEPVNGLGDGDTAPDWELVGPLALRLRAERAGTGSGRMYTIRVRFTDGVGNGRLEDVTVVVPHDQGSGG